MSSGLPGLGKRGLGLCASPPSHDSSSDAEALLGLGESHGGSSAKRRRGGSSVPTAPPARAVCQVHECESEGLCPVAVTTHRLSPHAACRLPRCTNKCQLKMRARPPPRKGSSS